MAARTSFASCQVGRDSFFWVGGGFEMATEITFQVKALIGLCLLVGVGGIALITYKLHQLYRAIVDLHCDISVIRLDNSRTMAELRRRHR